MRSLALIFLSISVISIIWFSPDYKETRSVKVGSNDNQVEREQEVIAHIHRKKQTPLTKFKFDNPNAYVDYHWGIRTRKSEAVPGYTVGNNSLQLRRAKNTKYYKNYESARTAALEWTERGPANVPGRTRAILVMPDDPEKDTWFAGGVGGGIWKTEDGGTSWVLKTPDIPSLAITWLATSSSNPEILYAATGEANGGGRGLIGNGVLKSIDGGENWEVLSSSLDRKEFAFINRIIVDQQDPDNVLICTTQGEWDRSFRSEIYKSTDGGLTWHNKYDSDSWLTQLIAHPDNFNTIYAAKWADGVLKSIDGGETWTKSSFGISKVFGRLEIAIAPSDSSRLYAAAQGNISGSGADLYVSFDGAETWSIVDQKYDDQVVEFFRGQGDYDNTIAVNPYDADEVYYGGVNLWKTNLKEGTETTQVAAISVGLARDTLTFWNFVNFNAEYFNGRLEKGGNLSNDEFVDVEIRTGPGLSQLAHRFTVEKNGSGVPDSGYYYQDYVEIPLEVWDINNNRQLMVSFRDQQEDGIFNLITQNISQGEEENHSREYVYVHLVEYASDADPDIAQRGGENIGHQFKQMYFFWPVLRDGYSWDPDNLLQDTISIDFDIVDLTKRFGELVPVSDAYGDYQENLNPAYNLNNNGFAFHPDHHNLIMIPVDKANETFRILNSNDGGVYISNTSGNPGIFNGNWTSVGRGFNTGQFYSAVKKPGAEVYLGGMQDNGSWKSPDNIVPGPDTDYESVWGGDGFDVLWNYLKPSSYIVSVYNNRFYRTENNGRTWANADIGINGVKPFFSKLASSNNTPDHIYTVSSLGVYYSRDFGKKWTLTSIDDGWGFSNFIDIKVSIANPQIIWAGSGMDDDLSVHVSTDGGVSFTKTTNFTEAELGFLSGMATHPQQDSVAYILFSFSKGPKVLRTRDLGASWEDISGFNGGSVSSNGFPDVAVYSLLVRPDDTNILWAGTEIGIFESVDDGETWHYLDNEMGAAAVWDMTVMDDKVVIATHGRGIFTATLPEQVEVILNPTVEGYGTSLSGDLNIVLGLRSDYDSTIVSINGMANKIDKVSAGNLTVQFAGLPVEDSLGISVTSYRNGKAYIAPNFHTSIFNVNEPVREYLEDFNDGSNDFFGERFLITKFTGFDDLAIHTQHPYEEGVNYPGESIDYLYQLKTPIIVADDNAIVQFEDIALVEPGEIGARYLSEDFYDYVVVEGSKDGIQWESLINGYDARKNTNWLNAYNQSKDGDKSMFVTQSIDLLQTFSPSDTIFIRFKLYSDPLTIGWGWAIDNLAIQQKITGLEDASGSLGFNVYPNPVGPDRILKVQFSINQKSPINLRLMDIHGQIIYNLELEAPVKGVNRAQIDLSNVSKGVYILSLQTREAQIERKIVLQ
jgi:photosystem II stability/assembly factor-like uncharacterized protein